MTQTINEARAGFPEEVETAGHQVKQRFRILIVEMRSRKESAQIICREHPRDLSELTTRAGASITWPMIEIWPL